jgi:hypothetical protein
VWHRVISWWVRLHRWKWRDVRRRLVGPGGRRPPAAGGRDRTVQHRLGERHWYRCRGIKIPNPWDTAQPRLTTEAVESPLPGDRHGGFGERPGETAGSTLGTALQADSTKDAVVQQPDLRPHQGRGLADVVLGKITKSAPSGRSTQRPPGRPSPPADIFFSAHTTRRPRALVRPPRLLYWARLWFG